MEKIDPDRLLSTLTLQPPRANRFIVTLYGDVVEPRGGALWMGSLIESCAQQGISESLVRTAVSRLVASGHLEGQRIGRKSFYRLTVTAREEFAYAARLFYEPLPTPDKWLVALDRDAAPARRWAQLGPRTYIASDISDDVSRAGILLEARSLCGDRAIGQVASELWPLSDLAAQYQDFVLLFEGLYNHIAAGGQLSPQEALRLRLQLVHRFRLIVLQDPRLPEEALCQPWPGVAARRVFSNIYLGLTGQADDYIAQTMQDADGTLPAKTEETERRKASLEDCRAQITG